MKGFVCGVCEFVVAMLCVVGIGVLLIKDVRVNQINNSVVQAVDEVIADVAGYDTYEISNYVVHVNWRLW